MKTILYSFPPIRWLRTLFAIFHYSWIHPNAVIFGAKSQVKLGYYSKLSSRVCIDPGSNGIVEIHDNVWIASDVEMQTNSFISIGRSTTIQKRCIINGSSRIGRSCVIGPNVFISSGTHVFRYIPHLTIREQEKIFFKDLNNINLVDGPIWIQDDCWIGVNAVILPNVTVGKGSIVGANSVVTQNISPYCIVAGSPAREIGCRLKWAPPSSLDPRQVEDHPYFLDANFCEDDEGNICVRISNKCPLIFALSIKSHNQKVCVNWRSRNSAIVVAGGSSIKLSGGHGTFFLINDDNSVIKSEFQFEIALSPNSPPDSSVDILKIELID